jgi:signal transduction histidine kinase
MNDQAKAIMSGTGPPRADIPKARILIVDDDERNAFAISTVLEELDQTLVIARSGEEALRCLLHDDFAVILLDLHMPGMDGYETAGLIRARQKTRHIPIVFLTAVYRDESHLFQAYSAGAVDMVFKPVDPFVLKAKVAVFVDLYLKTAEVERQADLRHRLQEENFKVRTEKLLAEQALRRSQNRQEAILRVLPIVFHSRLIDPPFAPLFVSDNVESVTGFRAEHFVAQPDFGASRIHPDDKERVFAELAAAARSGSYQCEYRWRCSDDQYRTFLDQGVLAPAETGEPREIFGSLLDVTDRRFLEQELAQARKMEAVGQLTGGVAHDFNNLLTVVLGNVDLVGRQLQDNQRAARQLQAMRHAAERAQSLTRQLLAFSRRQHLEPKVVDVTALIGDFEPLMRHALGENVVLDLDLREPSLASFIDPSQLEAALLNLSVNARDAMPQGGRLTICGKRIAFDDDLVRHHQEAPRGPWILVTVRDTGTGMSQEVLERVFEPFFTTKETGKGSGLGLSQVYGFVRQSGGYVRIVSNLGVGTEVRLYLPQTDRPLTQQGPTVAAERLRARRSETILLVEDDANVLALGIELLTDLGYRVLTASHADGALDIIRRGDPVDLIFSDVVMAGKNGIQLAAEALELRPSVKILLTSGYPGSHLAGRGEDVSHLPIIAKPYRQDELAGRIRQVIEGRR